MLDDQNEFSMAEKNIAYFRDQYTSSNLEFWRRMGSVDFADRTVLDIGCGHGALSVHAAEQGAKRVVGVDIDRERIAFARENIAANFPQYSEIISFQEAKLEDVRGSFDMAMSKDSFEHIDDLFGMMAQIASRLTENGLLITGFSPLYFSPFGDHGRYLLSARRVPWVPAILPESLLFRVASRRRRELILSASDVGLNKLTPKAFREIVMQQGWRVVSLETNVGDKRGMRAMREIASIGPLEKYFTVNIYAQLQKPLIPAAGTRAT